MMQPVTDKQKRLNMTVMIVMRKREKNNRSMKKEKKQFFTSLEQF